MNTRKLNLVAVVSGIILSLMAAGAESAHADTELEMHLRTPYPSVQCFTLWDEQSGTKKVVPTYTQLPVGKYWVTGAYESAAHMQTDQTIVYYADPNCTGGTRGLIFFNPSTDGQLVGDHYNVDLVGKALQPCGSQGQSCN